MCTQYLKKNQKFTLVNRLNLLLTDLSTLISQGRLFQITVCGSLLVELASYNRMYFCLQVDGFITGGYKWWAKGFLLAFTICDFLARVFKVFRYSFSEAMPILFFFSCPIAMKFSPVIAYGLKIVNNCAVLSKIDITMTTTNKQKLVLIKAEFCVI